MDAYLAAKLEMDPSTIIHRKKGESINWQEHIGFHCQRLLALFLVISG
jgi:hypothetical protein